MLLRGGVGGSGAQRGSGDAQPPLAAGGRGCASVSPAGAELTGERTGRGGCFGGPRGVKQKSGPYPAPWGPPLGTGTPRHPHPVMPPLVRGVPAAKSRGPGTINHNTML